MIFKLKKINFFYTFLLFFCFVFILPINIQAKDYSNWTCPKNKDSLYFDANGVLQCKILENTILDPHANNLYLEYQSIKDNPTELEQLKKRLKVCGIEPPSSTPPDISSPVKTPPIVFTPEVGFPGFSGPITVDGNLFGKFIFALFTYSIYLSGVLAVIFVSIAGFKWVSAGGNQAKVSAAKNQLINSITGMFLVFATFLILSTINEDLVIMKEIEVQTIDPVKLINIEEINFTASGAGCPDYANSVNGIPASILNKPRSCSPADIKEVGSLGLGFISGPCHCACFVSNVLKYAGCGIEIDSNVNSLEAQLRAKGWIKSTNKKKNASTLGDVLVIDGHIGISMGGDEVLESGVIHDKRPFNGCRYKDTKCKNVWHGLNNADNSRQFMGGSCMSNQYIRIVTDWFRHAGEPKYEKIHNFRFWHKS